MKASVKTALACVLLLICASTSSASQQPTRQSLEVNKKKLADIQTTLTSNNKRMAELESQAQSLAKEIESQEKAVQELEGLVAYQEDEVGFLESPANTIIEVTGSKSFLIDFNGTRRFVMLHGIDIEISRDDRIFKSFKKQYTKKPIYVRCGNDSCSQVYLYISKSGTSLNAELVKSGLATATNEGKYDLVAFVPKSTPETSSGGSTYSGPPSTSSSSAGKDVQVKGYYRKDGTYVRPHTRSAPGTKKKN